MKGLILLFLLLVTAVIPVSALELQPPQVPEAGVALMPEEADSFADALWEMLCKGIQRIRPDLQEAAETGLSVICIALLCTILDASSGKSKQFIGIAAVVTVASLLLHSTDSLIHLGTDTVMELSEYGKLLLPVMTAALAAQGSVVTSSALYAGTATFDLILCGLISKLLIPMVYGFLILSTAHSALGQDIMKKLRDLVKWLMTWILKTLLTVFTTYISITGVVSGTTDAVALKATKLTISSAVPVVGGILSDASEAVLVSAGLMKNTAGVYGILALLAVFLSPFFRIGIHYAVLKATAALCGLFGSKSVTELTEDFSSAMGFLLAMTGTSCLLLLISTICFLKGAG